LNVGVVVSITDESATIKKASSINHIHHSNAGEVVAELAEAVLESVPLNLVDYIVADVTSFCSGEDWQKRIEQEIASRDVFYLFWSRYAKESPYVEREWRFAVKQKGLDCIDPSSGPRPQCPARARDGGPSLQ
jgi:hypothetical protein